MMSSSFWLQAVFNKLVVMRHLRQNAKRIVWNANRLLTMTWVSVFSGSQILASENRNLIIYTMKQTVFLRGVPVIFSAADLEDQTNIVQSTERQTTKTECYSSNNEQHPSYGGHDGQSIFYL